jgi:hypothetical protein
VVDAVIASAQDRADSEASRSRSGNAVDSVATGRGGFGSGVSASW